jgi:hypothetical protein
LSRLNHQCSEVSAEWHVSSKKKDLVKAIEKRILTQSSLFLDSALCLGLGSLDGEYWELEEMAGELHTRPRIFLQLLVFETIVNCLRTYHSIFLRYGILSVSRDKI